MDYPGSQWERIMNIKDVFSKARHQTITWKEAAEVLGVDARTVRRWKIVVNESGYEGLLDRRTQTPSPKRAPEKIRDEVKRLYREIYLDWNVKHFCEQFHKYRIPYKYTWTKNVLQEAGLVAKSHKRDKHRRKRVRKPLVGMMLHIDGSDHEWIPLLAPERQDLIVVMDDANNDVYYAKLVNEEDTRECMLALWHTVARKGVFCSVYSDRAGHFFKTPKAGQKVDLSNLTQIGRSMFELGIEMIPAYSPQARGRSERLNGTWQGRLPNELKLHGIKTVPDANRYILETFLPWYRKDLLKTPIEEGSAFVPYRGKDLKLVFSLKEERVVNCDNTIQWNKKMLQIEPSKFRISFAKCRVMIHEHLNGPVTVVYGPHIIGEFDREGRPLKGSSHIHMDSQRKRKEAKEKERLLLV